MIEQNPDFSHSFLLAKQALTELHDAMLEDQFDDAVEAGFRCLADVKLTISAIRAQKEERERIR